MKRLNELLDNWPRALLFIFVAALFIRGVFVLSLQDGFYFWDSISYTRAAGNLLSAGEFPETFQRSPGYPVFLAALFAVFGNSILAIRLVESVTGALLAVVIAMLGKRVGGVGVGALAGVLWSIYPLGIFIAGLVYPNGLMTMLLACGALCLLPESHKNLSRKRVFVGGVLLGAAALTVSAGLATIVMISLWLVYWGRPHRLMFATLFILGAALTIVPWTVRNFHVHGRLVAIEPRIERHLPRVAGSPGDDPDNRVKGILRRPDVFAARFAREFLHFWQLYPDRIGMSRQHVRDRFHQQDSRIVKDTIFGMNRLINLVSILSTLPLFVFGIIGTIAMGLRKEQRRELSMLWTMILSFSLGYSLFFTQMRYRIPIEPYIVILSAYGLAETWVFL